MLRVLGLEQRFSLLWFIFVAGIMVDTFFLLAPFSFLGSSWGPAGKMTPPPPHSNPSSPAVSLPPILPFVRPAAIPASSCAYRCRKSWN